MQRSQGDVDIAFVIGKQKMLKYDSRLISCDSSSLKDQESLRFFASHTHALSLCMSMYVRQKFAVFFDFILFYFIRYT